jgi:hypothetical protein
MVENGYILPMKEDGKANWNQLYQKHVPSEIEKHYLGITLTIWIWIIIQCTASSIQF